MKTSHCIVFLISLLMLASCKVRIIVPEGGTVTTQSGAYSCASGKTCNIDVVDFYFNQVFVAKPANGYTFKFWKKGNRRFCGQDTKPCRVTTVGTNDNKDLAKVMMSFFESNELFYLQPVFAPKAPDPILYGIFLSEIRGGDNYIAPIIFNDTNTSAGADRSKGINISQYDFIDAEFVNGQLYAVTKTELYQVQLTPFSVKLIGTLSFAHDRTRSFFSIPIRFLTSNGGNLYTWMYNGRGSLGGDSALFKIDQKSAVMTQIGAGIDYSVAEIDAMTSDKDGRLLAVAEYPVNDAYLHLLNVNTSNGSLTKIGDTVIILDARDMASTEKGLISIRGPGFSSGALFQIDPNTGRGTGIGSYLWDSSVGYSYSSYDLTNFFVK